MKNKIKLISIILFTAIIMFFPVRSISKEKKITLDDFTQICLTPGENETMLNFSWYSKPSDEVSEVKIYEKGRKEIIYEGENMDIGNGFVSNKVTAKNLKPNTTYFYSYKSDGLWSKPVEYKTGDFQNYAFVFMSDPQIGASLKQMQSHEEGVNKDTYNWNRALKKSLGEKNNISFIVSGGDNTNTKENSSDLDKIKKSNLEYSGFLSPNYLRYMPIASAIGNHDESNENFYNHFNMPNLTQFGKTVAGGDYYFTYGNALYLFINTNNLNIYEHEKFISEAVEKNKNKKWRIVIFHHDIYGGGKHKNDEDIEILRNKLPPILEEHNINLALCGHDHIYSRTYPLENNKIIMDFEVKKLEKSKKEIDIIKSNKGITYITGSSATGSKFYKNDKHKSSYIKKYYLKEIPTYTIININEDSIDIQTYEIKNNKQIDNKIVIYN